MRMILPLVLLPAVIFAGCSAATQGAPHASQPAAGATSATLLPLERRLFAMLPNSTSDTLEIAVAIRDLQTGDSLLIAADRVMHAASTMKVPVMFELFRRIDAAELTLDQPIPVGNQFRSIADGSSYSLTTDDDSDTEIYERVGETLPLGDLIERMIVLSSNLATNLLIDLAAPEAIAIAMEEIGASGMNVLRGVEDIPAFRAGLNNTTTAYGLMKVLEAVASADGVSRESADEMIRILEAQTFRETIPSGLPAGVRVGNKTGWITAIQHDAAIVMPEGRAPYVLVILARGYRDRDAAQEVGIEISRAVYEELVQSR
jgi:beta-lactamase class A